MDAVLEAPFIRLRTWRLGHGRASRCPRYAAVSLVQSADHIDERKWRPWLLGGSGRLVPSMAATLSST